MVHNILHDRRGATAVLFTVAAATFIGMVGFGVEGGSWYLERRHGQNAADSAAIAGVLALVQNRNAGVGAVQTAATTVASHNGYTQGGDTTVTIKPGLYSGGAFTPSAGIGVAGSTCTDTTCNAVQATIIRSETRYFTALVLGGGTQNVKETALAALPVASQGCALSLTAMQVGGNTTLSGCSLASNGPIGFNGTGNQQLVSGSTDSVGACTAKGSGNPCGLMFQPPTQDPFAAQLASATMPPTTASTTTCENMSATPVPYENNTKMFCTMTIGSGKSKVDYTGDLNVANGQTVDLLPGTYVFHNASVSVASGGTLECTTCAIGGAGVTIILTGDSGASIGTLTIKGTVLLNAPHDPTFEGGAFKGILFYMDSRTSDTNGKGNAPVDITANGSTQLTGGMYFPSVTVSYLGNAVSATGACTEIVAQNINFTSDTTLQVSGCSAVGTNVAQVKAVQLIY